MSSSAAASRSIIRPVVAVVGGGLAGLTAAYLLAQDGERDVVLLEAAPQVGGKLRGHEVAGVRADVGAEAMLARRPEGIELARALGLAVVHPATTGSQVLSRGALRPLPRSLMGVPLDLAALASSRVLSAAGLARVRAEPGLPASELDIDIHGDVSVGDLVAARFGDEVTDRLVEPLLGGVYAGRARQISARAAVPQLLAMAQRISQRGSLLEQAALIPAPTGPVFAGLEGGMHVLAQALADSGRFEVRAGVTVREVISTGSISGGTGSILGRSAGTPSRFRLTLGSTRDPAYLDVDAVVLATPAAPTARLLVELAPVAAAELAQIESASVAVVTLAFATQELDGLDLPGRSGFLVPPVEQRVIKASTYSSSKWDWTRAAGEQHGVYLLRTSIGRIGEEQSLQVGDEELAARSCRDLAGLIGLAATPVDSNVQRWGGGLPQYAVGHVDRVARIRAEVARVPGLEVCGAAYDGVGIPAVIASARAAVEHLDGAQVGTAQ